MDKQEFDEKILPDDYPIYADFYYVVDGRPYRSDYHGITAGHLKKLLGAQEVRSCDLVGRVNASVGVS